MKTNHSCASVYLIMKSNIAHHLAFSKTGISMTQKFTLFYCEELEETIATSSSPQYSVKPQLFQVLSPFWESCL